MPRLDAKFEVGRELEASDGLKVLEATALDGRSVRVDWFEVSDPRTRAGFHRLRAALKAAGSPLLLDVVARPGAYYSVWLPTEAPDAASQLAARPRDDAFREALRALAATLAEYGFALADARVVAHADGREESRPALHGLRLADRPADEIASLNRPLLAPAEATSRRAGARRAVAMTAAPPIEPAGNAAARPRAGFGVLAALLGVLPGLVLLGLAGLEGARAASAFLDPPTVSVPAVEGKTLGQAASLLAGARLAVQVEEGADQSRPPEIVLEQRPTAGATLHQSRTVVLRVNRPRPLAFPNLVGKSLPEARETLQALGLRLDSTVRSPVPDLDVAPGLVVAQTPEASRPAVRGAGVTLLLASEPPAEITFLPDLRGLDLATARGIIRLAGLALTEVRESGSTQPAGTVLGQLPAPNTRVAVGGEAVLRIAVPERAPAPARPAPPAVRPAAPIENPQPAPEPDAAPAQPPADDPALPPEPEASPAPGPDAGPSPAPGASPTPGSGASPAPRPGASPAPAAVDPNDPNARSVTVSYLVPPTVATGVVQIRVMDALGERTVYEATLPGGFALRHPDTVSGPATVIVFLDGVEVYRQAVP